MTRTKTLAGALAVAATVLALTAAGSPAHAAEFDVTIYNLSNQVFSPPIVVTHRPSSSIFQVGQPASPELAAMAEDADSEGLIALLGTTTGVRDVAIGSGVIPPGGSMSVRVRGASSNNITVLGMLVTTNDTFYSATARVRRSATFRGPGYDAGSEANTLSCAHIPGPPCGNAGVRVTDGAEGTIRINEGINRGSLRGLDWRNPVVQVRAVRVSNN